VCTVSGASQTVNWLPLHHLGDTFLAVSDKFLRELFAPKHDFWMPFLIGTF
jgi:hypothetical protein